MNGSARAPTARTRLDEQRCSIAKVLLPLAIITPILVTLDHSASRYQLAAVASTAFSLILLPEALRELRLLLRSPLIRAVGWAALVLAIGWQLFSGPMWRSERTVFYLTLPLFYAANVAWFREHAVERLHSAFVFKLAITVFASTWIAAQALTDSLRDVTTAVVSSPPIYYHFRHVNPDVFSVVALIVCFWPTELRTRLMFGAALALLGYFSVWSGGRAEFVGLMLFGGLLIGFRTASLLDARLIQPLLWFAAGGALVFALGQTQFVDRIPERTLTDSADLLTSARAGIWLHSLARLLEYPETTLFGFGPDAYERIGISLDMLQITGIRNPTSHPHNTVVLWLLEFGVVGTIPLLLLATAVIRRALSRLRMPTPFQVSQGVSAILITTFVFSLVDCQFYYAAPLMLFLVLAAFQKATVAADMAHILENDPA